TVLGLGSHELVSGILDGFFPAYFTPWVRGVGANHRFGDALLVRGIAPGKAAFYAGMAIVGFAALGGNHAHDLVTFHLGAEGATDTAVGAGGFHGVVGGAQLDYG